MDTSEQTSAGQAVTGQHEALLLAGTDLDQPGERLIAGGSSVFFACRAPDKEAEQTNEDAIALIPLGTDAGVLAIADGMGGTARGGEASRLAISCLRDALSQMDDIRSCRAQILDGLEQADQQIKALGVGAGTTIVVAEIQGHSVRPYHAGDSHLLVIGQRGKVRLETIPHSPVGYAMEAGMLDRKGAMFHDDRHLISNFLGSQGFRIEIGSAIQMRPRDTLVLGSDGLFDNLHQHEVIELVRKGPMAQAAMALQDRSNQRMSGTASTRPSKPDDLSFVLYRPIQ